MPVGASEPPRLEAARDGGWWFRQWTGSRVVAGVTDRRLTTVELLQQVPAVAGTAEAEQVHGAGVAVVERPSTALPGCDALLTARPGLALLIRTADCLPIFFVDPRQGVVGLAHAGWRGLAAGLPARMVAALRHYAHSRPDTLQVAIGPAIRSCCYEVGPEFEGVFGPFVQVSSGRRTCDLPAAAITQLLGVGVHREHILDSAICTACDLRTWFSLRREGAATGRLTSLILLKP